MGESLLDRADASTKQRDVAAAIDRAIAFLGENQLHSGAFANHCWTHPDIGSRVADPSVFPTALIAYCLSFSDRCILLRDRALDFLTSQADRRGLWRHWSRDNPRFNYACPDLDDSCCASIALRKAGRSPPDNRARILANRSPQGTFRTWVITLDRLLLHPLATYLFFTRPASRPSDVDGVVNANALFYLGDVPETRAAADYLIEILRENRERSSDKWYDDPFVVWYFFSRALADGSPEGALLIEARILDAAPAEPLHLALAACSLLNLRSAAAGRFIPAILDAQLASGAWPIAPFYKGGEVRWGSEELTTAFCVEALTRGFEAAGS